MKKVIESAHLIEQLNLRYATKKFDSSKKISASDWKTLEASLVLTPSSYGLQPWKFLVVQDLEVRKQLRAVSWGQSQVEEASHYVVFLSKRQITPEYISSFAKRTAEVRGVAPESLDKMVSMIVGDVITGPRAAVASEWMARQDYIALGNLMTCAALMGVDTCPMEGLDPLKYDQILGLEKSEYHTIVACALGYRHSDDTYQKLKKVRFPTEHVVEYR
jgi:nitroreductase